MKRSRRDAKAPRATRPPRGVRAEAGGDRRQLVATPAELARVLGVNRSTGYDYARLVGREADGRIDVAKVRRAIAATRTSEHARRALGNLPAGADLAGEEAVQRVRELRDVELLRKRLQATLLADEVKRARGDSVDRARVDALLRDRMREWKRSLRNCSRRLGPRVLNKTDLLEVIEIIDQAHDELLWEAYGRPLEVAGRPPPGDDVGGADEAEPDPVA